MGEHIEFYNAPSVFKTLAQKQKTKTQFKKELDIIVQKQPSGKNNTNPHLNNLRNLIEM